LPQTGGDKLSAFLSSFFTHAPSLQLARMLDNFMETGQPGAGPQTDGRNCLSFSRNCSNAVLCTATYFAKA
jgi:hypothetical protein